MRIKVVFLDHGELVEDEPYCEPGGHDAHAKAFSDLDSALLPFPPQVGVHHRVPLGVDIYILILTYS